MRLTRFESRFEPNPLSKVSGIGPNSPRTRRIRLPFPEGSSAMRIREIESDCSNSDRI